MMFSRHNHHNHRGSYRSSGNPPPMSPSLMRRAFHRGSTKSPRKKEAKEELSEQEQQQQQEERHTPVATRARLDTEDTLRMNNLNLPSLLLDDDNPFLECHQQYTPEAVKRAAKLQRSAALDEDEKIMDSSTVSSLGDGSFKRPPAPPMTPTPAGQPPQQQQSQQPEGAQEQPFIPPKMICFRVEAEVPDWLLGGDDDVPEPATAGTSNHIPAAKETEEGAMDKDDNLSLQRTNTATTATDDDNTAESYLPRPPQMPYRPHRHYVEQHWNAHPSPMTMTPIDPFSPQTTVMTPRTLGMVHLQQQQQPCMPPPLWTGMPSPAANHPRPTIGRHKSASCVSPFPVRTPSPSAAVRHIFPQPSPLSMSTNTNASSLHTPSRRSTPGRRKTLPVPPIALTLTPTPKSSSAKNKSSKRHSQHQPQQSPRHHHHRRNKSAESASLLGGQTDSLWTAPTTASSLLDAPSLEQQTPCKAHAKRKSAVVQELRCMWNKVMTRSSDSATAEAHGKNTSLSSSAAALEEWRLNSAHTGCFT